MGRSRGWFKSEGNAHSLWVFGSTRSGFRTGSAESGCSRATDQKNDGKQSLPAMGATGTRTFRAVFKARTIPNHSVRFIVNRPPSARPLIDIRDYLRFAVGIWVNSFGGRRHNVNVHRRTDQFQVNRKLSDCQKT